MNEPQERTTPLTEEEKRNLDHIEEMLRRCNEERDYECGEVDIDQDGH